MGFNAQAYLNAGGFAPLGTGEDRALHRAILGAGGRALEDMELRVITSGRRLARAPLGFAHALSSFLDDVTDLRAPSPAATEWHASSTSSDSGARA
jgi:hypothetical protein